MALSWASLGRGLAAALGLVAALAAWPAVRDAVCRHPYFAVREVVVRGRGRLGSDEIRRVAGIEPGVSIWNVDCEQAEDRLRHQPWVRSACVRRELPHRVVIQVREERPTAILATTEPALYYVGAHGRIVAPVGSGEPRDFPYLTGLGSRDVSGADAFGPRGIRRALGLLRLAARAGAVSEIHIDRARGLTLLPVQPTVPIELGWGRFAEKLQLLPAVMAQWAGREAEIAGVSLLFDGEVIVRTRAAKPAARAPGI